MVASFVLARQLQPHCLGGIHKRDALYPRVENLRGSTCRHGKEPVSAGSGRVGKNDVASPPRHCRLTVSPASTDVALLIRRAVDLAAAALDNHFEHPARNLRRRSK